MVLFISLVSQNYLFMVIVVVVFIVFLLFILFTNDTTDLNHEQYKITLKHIIIQCH